MANLSVNAQQPIQPAQSSPTTSQKPTPKTELKTPDKLFAAFEQPDQSKAKSPPAGAATHQVNLVEEASVPEPTPEDIQWASELETKAAKGYEATPEETKRYQKVLLGLQAKQQAAAKAAGIPDEDMKWAAELEAKASQGYQATPEEVTRYQGILSKLQGGAQQQAPAAPQAPNAPSTTTAPSAPAAPQAPDSTETAVADLNPVVDPNAKPPVDMTAKFQELDALLAQKKYMFFGEVNQPDQVRATGVQIWLDGSQEDRLQLAQKLVAGGQSELLGRVMSHEETKPLEIAQLMSKADFPVQDFMKDLDDNHAFLILDSLATVAAMGEPSSSKVMEKVISAYDGRLWDREGPFKQLKNDRQAQGNWETLPAELRQKIDELLK